MRIYEVAEVGGYIKDLLEADEQLADLWIKGELTNVTRSGAGHYYFSLKDSDGQLRSVMFRGAALRCGADPRMGDEVVAHGRIAFYQPTGVCEFCVDLLYPSGVGIAQLRFEALRLKLEEEGLFAAERKRALPPFPRRIGLITSEGGAAVHDVLTVLARRYPLAEVVFAHSAVQGERAARELVAALLRLRDWRGADELGVDVVIIGRGGGSPEELACFNDERLARTIFSSPWPVIAAVGHETDETICDYVADLRAPTPSAAAELVAPDLGTLNAQVYELAERGRSLIRSQLQVTRGDLAFERAQLLSRSPNAEIRRLHEATRLAAERCRASTESRLGSVRDELAGRRLQLAALSPIGTLARGFAIVSSDDGSVVRGASAVEPGDGVSIQLVDGTVEATAVSVARRSDAAPRQVASNLNGRSQ
jgi:exodeoxyribonuclease VII large subunit